MNRYEYLVTELEYIAEDKRHNKAVLGYIKRAIESIKDLLFAKEIHAHWIVNRTANHTVCRCSECGEEYYYHNAGQYKIEASQYCPNCGAKMDMDGEVQG